MGSPGPPRRQTNRMNAAATRQTLEEAFRRIRAMDGSLNEQLQTLASSSRERQPEFACEVALVHFDSRSRFNFADKLLLL